MMTKLVIKNSLNGFKWNKFLPQTNKIIGNIQECYVNASRNICCEYLLLGVFKGGKKPFNTYHTTSYWDFL